MVRWLRSACKGDLIITMSMKEYLNNQLINGIDFLKSFSNPSFVRYVELNNVDLSSFTLPIFSHTGYFEDGPTAYREEYREYVQKTLKGITNPCLYVFELVSPDAQSVFEAYKAFVNKQEKLGSFAKRSCSSINSTYVSIDNEPRILYVGKSEKPIDGRIVVHFGYYEKGVPGMQLVYWGKEIGLKLNLHVFELVSSGFQPYLEALEKILFIQLRPLIGKR